MAGQVQLAALHEKPTREVPSAARSLMRFSNTQMFFVSFLIIYLIQWRETGYRENRTED